MQAGGVPIILSLLDTHPSYSDLHRVAAVVLLRMLQESTHVGREITSNEGVRILLKSLEKGGAQQDTVAAVTHILFAVTNPSSPSSLAIEPQLWLQIKTPGNDSKVGEGKSAVSNFAAPQATEFLVGKQFARSDQAMSVSAFSPIVGSNPPQTALGGLVKMLGQYCERKDVVRAACRLLNNLGGYPGVVSALEKLNILDRVLECVSIHSETRDVVDSCCILLKTIHKVNCPVIRSPKVSCVRGLLHVFRNKLHDEDSVAACADALAKRVESLLRGERNRELDDYRTSGNNTWEYEAIFHSIRAIEKMGGQDCSRDSDSFVAPSSYTIATTKKLSWSKNSSRVLNCLLNLVENVSETKKLSADPIMHQNMAEVLRNIMDSLPSKSSDISRRIERLLNSLAHPSTMFRHGSAGEEPGHDELRSSQIFETETNSINDGVGRDMVLAKHAESFLPDSISSDRENTTRPNSFNDDKKLVNGTNAISTFTVSRNQRFLLSDGADTRRAVVKVDVIEEGTKKYLPQHPLKNSRKSEGAPMNNVNRLLDRWPNFLERLVMVQNPTPLNRSYSMSSHIGSAFDRMHIVHESQSAGGKGVVSRCPNQVPYHVPPEGIGEPFEHSLTFDSDFESGNLLRAVQREGKQATGTLFFHFR